MVKELNFDHDKIKSRDSLYRHTSSYSYTHNKKNKLSGGEKARQAVKKAIKEGKLKNLKTNIILCSYCGYRAKIYEHRDYNHPLDVLPCCNSCNQRLGAAEHCSSDQQ